MKEEMNKLEAEEEIRSLSNDEINTKMENYTNLNKLLK